MWLGWVKQWRKKPELKPRLNAVIIAIRISVCGRQDMVTPRPRPREELAESCPTVGRFGVPILEVVLDPSPWIVPERPSLGVPPVAI